MQFSAEQRVVDELDIIRLLARLAHACDDMDAKTYGACLAEAVLCRAEWENDGSHWREVPRQVYTERSINALAPLDWTHHQLMNHVISVEGDRASAKVDVLVTLQATDVNGTVGLLTLGGRYDLEFARFPSGWKITKRYRIPRYTVGDPTLLKRLSPARLRPASH